MRKGESYYWKPHRPILSLLHFVRGQKKQNKEVEGLEEELLKELSKYLKLLLASLDNTQLTILGMAFDNTQLVILGMAFDNT